MQHHHRLAAFVALSVLNGCAKSKTALTAASLPQAGALELVEESDPNGEVVRLNFNWPSGTAKVIHSRTRKGPDQNDLSKASGVILVERLDNGGMYVQSKQHPWLRENGEPIQQDLIAFTIDHAATVERTFFVDPDGEYFHVADADAWEAQWAEARSDIARATQGAIAAGDLIEAGARAEAPTVERLLGSNFRAGKDAYNWNRTVHIWDGLELKVGSVYQRVGPGPTGAPAFERLSLGDTDDCQGLGERGQCLSLFYETTIIPPENSDASAYGSSARPGDVVYLSSQVVALVDRDTLRPRVVSDTTWSGRVQRDDAMNREAVEDLVEHVHLQVFMWQEHLSLPAPKLAEDPAQ